LKKGQKISLKKQASGSAYIRIENGWTAPRKDYDLKALVRYRNGKTIYVGAANQDEVMMTPEGAVIHGGDIKVPGELEHIDIKWHPDIASVAVSSYSAIENGVGSFRQFGVFVRIINGDQVIEIAAADASANPKSYTLCFGEILFGTEQDSLEVSALEMYSRPSSENRIGYRKDKVVMDIGPRGRTK
jgi:tellurium resistance protein TerD